MSRSVCSCTLAALSALAQETIHLSSIGGRVTDPSGAPVEGAEITARAIQTNVTQAALAGRDGRFRFPYLKAATYELTAAKSGFAGATRVLSVRAGGAYEVGLELKLGVTETTLRVTAETPVLETARSQIASAVSQSEIRQLPLNGRSFLDLALLAPGVSPTNTASNQLFAETSAVPGQGISVGSQRNFSNNFMVDGLSANDDAAGLSSGFFGLDTVEELHVVTSGGQAELGRALGGFVSLVTRGGTNDLHGDLYAYFRNQRFNAANPLSNRKLPSTQSQHGASLSGPAIRDRAFYFSNFEQRLLNQSGLVTIAPDNAAAINSLLDASAFPGARVSTGIYPNPVHMTAVLGKADLPLSRRAQTMLRYNLYDVASRNSRGAGALSAPSASAGLDNRDHTLAAGSVLTLSPHTVLETRGQTAWGTLEALPTDLAGPAVNIAGVAVFGRLSGSPAARDNRMFELVSNLSRHSGPHALRAGLNILHNRTTITFPRAARGTYTFSSLANFRQGVYNNAGFTQTFGNSVVTQANPNLGLFVQDEWKILPSLTLNAGLRWDAQLLETIETDYNNFAPRAGFAWSPGAARRTVVRGGFGLYYDRIPLRALANALLSSSNTTALTSASQVTVSLSPAQAGAPRFPNIITTLPTGVLANFTTMDRSIENAYSIQRTFEVEHQLGHSTTLRASFQHLRGLHLIASLNQNVPSCVAAGNNNGCRPNPAFANNSQYRSQADSFFRALHVSVEQRPSRWGNYRISYSWSLARNNVGEFFFSSPVDPFNIWRDWGRSDDDQRHRLTAAGTLCAKGFEFGGMMQYYSALPLNATTGVTTVQGTAARPLVNGQFLERNAATGVDFLGVNLRLARPFSLTERLRLEASAEAFNALNHRNNLTRNGVFGSGAWPTSPLPAFRQVTAVHEPRSLQAALRLRF